MRDCKELYKQFEKWLAVTLDKCAQRMVLDETDEDLKGMMIKKQLSLSDADWDWWRLEMYDY